MEFKNKPWESQKGEEKFELFKEYRDLGIGRSYKTVAAMTGYSVRTIAEYARQNDWVFRVRLYDNYMLTDITNLKICMHESNIKELIQEKNAISNSLMGIYRELMHNYLENAHKLHNDPRANSMLAYYTKIIKLISLLNKNVNFVLDDSDKNADFNSKIDELNYEFGKVEVGNEECNPLSPENTITMENKNRRDDEICEGLRESCSPPEVIEKLKEEMARQQQKALEKPVMSAERTQNLFPSSRLGTDELERVIEDVPKQELGNKRKTAELHTKDAKDAMAKIRVNCNKNNNITENDIASFDEENYGDAVLEEQEYEIDEGSEQYIMTDEQLAKIWYIDRFEEEERV